MRAICLAHLVLLDLITVVICRVISFCLPACLSVWLYVCLTVAGMTNQKIKMAA